MAGTKSPPTSFIAVTAPSVAVIGDENARQRSRLPLMERSAAMQQQRFKQQASLRDRITEWAVGVREEAAAMPPGPDREQLLRKLRHAETAMYLDDWANSPGLQSPK